VERAAQSSMPEDIFVDLFREALGLEKAQMLVHEFPYWDFLGNLRFIDYALKTTDSQVAFEIDGPDHYNGALMVALGKAAELAARDASTEPNAAGRSRNRRCGHLISSAEW
jgi:hypothetical protein